MCEKAEKIKFYILVPVYKTEQYIEKCLKSILNQNYQNFELVVVDDGTPDNAGQICDQYADKDNRITVIHKKNEGIISSRQVGVQSIFQNHVDENTYNNSYVMFVDSDDYLLDNVLGDIAKDVQQIKSDMYIYNYEYIDNYNRLRTIENENPKNILTLTDKKKLYEKVFCEPFYNNLWRKVTSLKFFNNFDYTDYYDINRGEDLIISLNLYKQAYSVTFSNQKIYHYNLNNESITNNKNLAKYESHSKVNQIVWNFIIKENVWDESTLEKYINREMHALHCEIFKIMNYNINLKTKKLLISQIAKDAYYQNLLSNSKRFYMYTLILRKSLFYPAYAMLRLRGYIANAYTLLFK